jgi:hypothetical protein
MAEADVSRPDQVAVFPVPRSVVLIRRLSEIALGASGLVMIAAVYPWGGPPPPDSIDHIVWPALAVGVAAPAAFVWSRWHRIPPRAAGGALRIGPEGVDYRVGPDHVRLGWSQIAGIHPVTRPSKEQILAVWLPRDDPDPPNSSRRTLLEIAHLKSPYRPVSRKDGVVLPLRLFGHHKDVADGIVQVLQRQHAGATASATRIQPPAP